jgi:exopolysaccharide production protein ExoZ
MKNNLTNTILVPKISRTFDCLDVVRGIAAFSVLIHHYNQQFPAFHQNYILDKVLSHLGTWGVTIFFVLSGFCIHWAEIIRRQSGQKFSLKQYTIRRFYRIYPAFFVCIVFCVLIGVFCKSNIIDRVSFPAFLSHITLTSSFNINNQTSINSVLWTVVLEMHFYILYGIFQKHFMGLSNTVKITTIAIALAFTTYLISVHFFDTGLVRLTIQKSFAANWWIWCLGAFAAEIISSGYKLVLSAHIRRTVLVLLIILSLAIALLPQNYISHASRFLLPFIAFAVIIVLLHENSKIQFLSLLRNLGNISYSLYLFHPIAILIGTFFVFTQAVHFIVVIIISIVMAAFIYKYVELPSKKLGYINASLFMVASNDNLRNKV